MNQLHQVLGFGAILLSLFAGCQPPALSYVLEHREEFAQTEDSLTAALVPGTVRDDLDGLSGCFGAYSIWSSGLLSLPDAEAYTFDTSTGQMRYMVWQAGVVAGHSAAFEPADKDRIKVTRLIAECLFSPGSPTHRQTSGPIPTAFSITGSAPAPTPARRCRHSDTARRPWQARGTGRHRC